jgi:hypothetical protein
MDEYEMVWMWCFSLGSSPRTSQYRPYDLENPRDEWGPKQCKTALILEVFGSRDTSYGQPNDMLCPYRCSLNSLAFIVKGPLFSHTGFDFSVLRLVELVWMRDTTPWPLDLYFMIMEKPLFPLSKSLVTASPSYCTLFVSLVLLYP